VQSLLPDVNGLRVLDAGCGPGQYADWLVERGAEVVAIDVTPRMVELAKDRLGDRATVFQHDLNQPLAFAEDASFDLVIAPLVLDYIADWVPVFSEFARVLKPGGQFVFSCGHPHGDYDWLQNKRGLDIDYFKLEQPTVTWGGFGETRPTITFYRRPLNMILNPIMAAGLTLDHILEPLPTEEFAKIDPDNDATLRKVPGFIVVRAKK